MKSNFALSLSFDGLRLMHRVTGGWHLVGEVALDVPDMTEALARLRDAAAQLEPSGLRTKLLIPNDQIKYLALDTTRAEDEDVRAALDGATPYAVQDLAYDFAKGGGRTYIAAVARETLDEAQQFASEHGFNPTDFAAIPEPFTFVGEANFGDLNGNPVEREAEMLVVIGTTPMSVASDAPESSVNAEQEAETVPDKTPEPQEEPEASTPTPTMSPEYPDLTIPETAPDEGKVEDVSAPHDSDAAEPEPEPEIVDAADESAPFAQDVEPVSEPEPEEAPEPEAEVAPVFSARLRADRTEGSPAISKPQPSSGRAEPSLSRPAPLAVPTDAGGSGPAIATPTRDTVASPSASVAAAPVLADTPEPDAAPPITGEAATTLTDAAIVSAASLTADRNAKSQENVSTNAEGAAAKALGAVGAVGGAVGGMFASRRMGKDDAKAEDPAAQTEPAAKSGISVFGALKKPAPKPVVGGKPRFLGLILTAILLLFLLAIAAFAALSEEGLAGWFRSNDAPQIAATAPDTAAGPAAASEVAADPESSDEPEPPTAATALPAPIAPTGGQVLTPEEAQRIYAATGVWQKAPRIPLTPRTTSLEGLIVDVATRPVTRVPASPLLDAGSVAGDAVIPTPVDPPAPSVVFEFDDRGLVVATPQGAVTPDGILVIAGRPALNPPTRPGTIAPEITPLEQLASVIPEDAAPLPDAPDGVLVIAGAPQILPPARPALPVEPVALPTQPEPAPDAVPSADVPQVAPEIPEADLREGLNVITGQPPVLPPVRPGTQAVAPVAVAPPVETAPNVAPDVAPDAPEGLNVIAGAPPVLPPVRPGTQALPVPATPLPEVTAEQAPPVQTAPSVRPLLRPASVTQAAVAVQNAPVLGALTPAQAAAFRPRNRPADLAPPPAPEPTPAPAPDQDAQAPQPVTPQPATGLQISPEIAAAVAQAAARPDPFATATRLAIPNSLRPDTRPRNMDRIVARAAQAQQRAATQVAAVAPRTVAPSGPTGGTVAQTATLESAINLREINLIGVYGGSGDRRALIRLGNGRYQRVTVGDSLDGGRVTAISANALSYSKRGRSITLQVPG